MLDSIDLHFANKIQMRYSPQGPTRSPFDSRNYQHKRSRTLFDRPETPTATQRSGRKLRRYMEFHDSAAKNELQVVHSKGNYLQGQNEPSRKVPYFLPTVGLSQRGVTSVTVPSVRTLKQYPCQPSRLRIPPGDRPPTTRSN